MTCSLYANNRAGRLDVEACNALGVHSQDRGALKEGKSVFGNDNLEVHPHQVTILPYCFAVVICMYKPVEGFWLQPGGSWHQSNAGHTSWWPVSR